RLEPRAGAAHESPRALRRHFTEHSGTGRSACAGRACRAQGAARLAGRGSDAQRAGAGGTGHIMPVIQGTRVKLQVDVEKWPLKAPFRITGYTFVEIDVVCAPRSARACPGRGGAAGGYDR